MALSGNDLEAIQRISRMPEFRAYLAVLEKRQAETDAKLRTASGEELYRQQGRAQLLFELLNDSQAAAQSLNRQGQTRPLKTAGSWPG